MADKETDNRIAIVMEGLAAEDGHVRGNDLQKELQLLLSVLAKTETKVLRERERTIYYRIVDLHHSSPATIVLEARPVRLAYDKRREVFVALEGIVRDIELGSLTDRVDTSLLRDLRDMTAPVGKTIAGATLSFNGTTVRLDQDLRRSVEEIIAPEETFNGTMTGMLESINVHGGANRFWIYPDLGPIKVKCDFAPELRDHAIEAVGHYVKVFGAIKYKTTSPYPHEIGVSDLVDLPQEDLPRLSDLLGVEKPLEGISSEQFVRKIRDALV